ncbi:MULTISPECIES: ABC transporter permease [Cysteiniphilum]|uniref:Transport permease protein n=1 Tax=Cysteiniphilum litorale TaxID=2056700 RepID=A0A8J3E945_9GAMM|nr:MULTISPECIES: ABC transporter permease [Cysteiniphilum]GGG04364.1 transport permease protein [Cysteiniphilum litorale]
MTFKEYWIIYYTILRKEVVRVLRIWPQTLLPSAITISLYFLIFGKVVGARVGTMDGFGYMHFITPGLVIMAVINNSYANVVGSFYGARFNHSIQELLVSPATNHLIILGYVSGGVARGFFVGVMVTIVAGLFGGISIGFSGLLLILLSFILCGTLFSLGGLLNGIFSQSFDDTTIFPTFVLTPLIYLGGVFYGLSALPPFWQHIAQYNPLFYIVDFVRYAFIGYSSVNPVVALVAIVLLIAILYSLAWYLLSRGIRLKS